MNPFEGDLKDHCWQNSLGQKLVEMLVCSGTNMVLQRALNFAKLDVLDWDIELVLSEQTSRLA